MTTTSRSDGGAPRYRLTRPATVESSVSAPTLDGEQQRVVEHRNGPLLVLAGPGTGKTSTLVEAAVARIVEGADPENMLVLTFSRKAAAQLRKRITERLGRTVTEPMARTFHSYAFGLLHRWAAAAGQPPPRLLSGPEQDVVIRELLAGDELGAGVTWPARLRPALATREFAGQLRDLLLRAYERGVSPAKLDQWGRAHGRDDWQAAARFMQQYADVTELRDASTGSGAAYDTAELIRAAAQQLANDPALLAAERARCAYVFVDEYQDTDPAQEELLRLLCGGGRFLVAVGDPDQSIYAFRGSDMDGIRQFPERFPTASGESAPTVALGVCRRSGSMLVTASRRVAARLRGPVRHRALEPLADLPPGVVEAHVLRSPSAEAAYVAHRLRRAHLLDGIPWSRMGVLVRSATLRLTTLRRAMMQAGVPVAVAGDELPLVDQPAVRHLLAIMRCALDVSTLDEEAAVELLRSPLGGADALSLRRLRQQLRRLSLLSGELRPSSQLVVSALLDSSELAAVDEQWAAPALRVARVLAAARAACAQPGVTAQQLVWEVWASSGLSERWQQLSAAGGARGAAADRDLDAVIALLEAATRFNDRLPGAGPSIFLDQVRNQRLPGDSLAPAARLNEAVRIVTAHTAKGLEWDFVAVCGVQEGLWPDLRMRGSLLGADDIVDLAADRPVGQERGGRVGQLLDEERRLFYVAITRARQQLVVTAVEDDDSQPSRFLDELMPQSTVEGEWVPREPTDVPRPLNLAGLVAELRAVVVDAYAPEDRRQQAAGVLARLARARVPGAAPMHWWGYAPLSDARSLREPHEPVPVSPSAVEKFDACALRWLLEAHGGAGVPSASQDIGVAVHEVAAMAGHASGVEQLLSELERQLAGVRLSQGWYGERQRERAQHMVRKLAGWLSGNSRRYLAAEREFATRVGRALLRGRVDRLEVDGDGRLVVVDFKTGAAAPAKDELPRHPQLAMYQLAVAEGGFRALSEASDDRAVAALDPAALAAAKLDQPGGAALVQLGTKTQKATEQHQPVLAESRDPEWAARLADSVASGMAGSVFAATENGNCRVCPVRGSCPIHSGQVTE